MKLLFFYLALTVEYGAVQQPRGNSSTVCDPSGSMCALTAQMIRGIINDILDLRANLQEKILVW